MASETKVVNLNHEPYDVYIGRAGKGRTGYFGNRHPIGWCYSCNETHDRDACIAAFKKDFLKHVESSSIFRQQVLELRGKRLGCFCKQPFKDVKCHGDVIKEWLDNHPNL